MYKASVVNSSASRNILLQHFQIFNEIGTFLKNI